MTDEHDTTNPTAESLRGWADYELGACANLPPESRRRLVRAEQARRKGEDYDAFLAAYDAEDTTDSGLIELEYPEFKAALKRVGGGAGVDEVYGEYVDAWEKSNA